MSQTPVVKRRSFLAIAALVPAAAVAVSVASRRREPVIAEPAAADATPPVSGYHETEHILKYYRSAAYF